MATAMRQARTKRKLKEKDFILIDGLDLGGRKGEVMMVRLCLEWFGRWFGELMMDYCDGCRGNTYTSLSLPIEVLRRAQSRCSSHVSPCIVVVMESRCMNRFWVVKVEHV